MTKIPLRLQAFLHGAPKSQNLVILNKISLKMHYWAPKRKKSIFGSKMLPAPFGPLWRRANLGENSRVGR